MNEEVLIICESIYHGNTQKLALAMAGKLNCAVMTAEQAAVSDIHTYKVIGLGSGIYFTSFHPQLFKAAEKIKQSQKVFLFSTHGAPFLGNYHQKMKDFLSERRIDVIGEFSCKGYDCTGPYIIIGGGNKGRPNEKDLQNAEKFIRGLLPQYCKNTDVVHNGKHIEIRYDECLQCGKCRAICPMNVFELEGGKPVILHEEDCIHCSLCKEQCPAQAISIQHSWKEAIQIAKRHAKRTSL